MVERLIVDQDTVVRFHSPEWIIIEIEEFSKNE